MSINDNAVVGGNERKRYLKVIVTEGDKTKVNVTVPLSLAKTALKFIPKDAEIKANGSKLDLQELAELLDHPDLGEFMVEVDENDQHVRVYVE